MPSNPLSLRLTLPAGFRRDAILSFYRRDEQEVAERVNGDGLYKGLIWNGAPAKLGLQFDDEYVTLTLHRDAASVNDSTDALEALARRLLGLTQPVAAFEHRFRHHPELGPLITRQAGLRVPQTATPFEALTWAITGQQISVAVAVSLRRKLILRVASRLADDLFCHPDAARVAALDEDDLRGCGFSASKTHTLLTVARLVDAGELPLDDWLSDCPAALIGERLLAIRGIGPWTVAYTLLRGYAWMDGPLHGDVAVRRGIQRLLGLETTPTLDEAFEWLAPFAPWRALVAAHLWDSLHLTA